MRDRARSLRHRRARRRRHRDARPGRPRSSSRRSRARVDGGQSASWSTTPASASREPWKRSATPICATSTRRTSSASGASAAPLCRGTCASADAGRSSTSRRFGGRRRSGHRRLPLVEVRARGPDLDAAAGGGALRHPRPLRAAGAAPRRGSATRCGAASTSIRTARTRRCGRARRSPMRRCRPPRSSPRRWPTRSSRRSRPSTRPGAFASVTTPGGSRRPSSSGDEAYERELVEGLGFDWHPLGSE